MLVDQLLSFTQNASLLWGREPYCFQGQVWSYLDTCPQTLEQPCCDLIGFFFLKCFCCAMLPVGSCIPDQWSNPGPLLGVPSPNHWTTREVLGPDGTLTTSCNVHFIFTFPPHSLGMSLCISDKHMTSCPPVRLTFPLNLFFFTSCLLITHIQLWVRFLLEFNYSSGWRW